MLVFIGNVVKFLRFLSFKLVDDFILYISVKTTATELTILPLKCFNF